MQALMENLTRLLREVGDMLLSTRSHGGAAGKWEGTQFKAHADILAHKMLSEGLARLTPGTPVISEEDSASHLARRPQSYWLIDPLDGTASYAGGFSGFVTQAALMLNNNPVLGAVRVPATDETYCALEGGPALLNNAPIHTCRIDAPLHLIDNTPAPHGIAARIFNALPFDKYMESGSLGLKICRIASGHATVFVKDVTVRDWDIAPGELILRQAGGALLTPPGGPPPFSGPWESSGLLAAANAETARICLDWLENDEDDSGQSKKTPLFRNEPRM